MAYRKRLVLVGRPATRDSARRAVPRSGAVCHGERFSDELVTENAEYSKNAPSWFLRRTKHTLPASTAVGAAFAIVTFTTTVVPPPLGDCSVVGMIVRLSLVVRQSSSTVRLDLKPVPATVIGMFVAFEGSDAGVTAVITGGGSDVIVTAFASTSTLPSGLTMIRS